MAAAKKLHLYEELLLLGLRDREGTVVADGTAFPYALGGALLAEFLLHGRIRIEVVKKKKYLILEDFSSTFDPILDEALEKLGTAKRRATLESWVSRFAGIKRLKHRAAEQLCRRGILRADEKSVLLIFSRKIYPELDPGPERALVERLRVAIFTEAEDLDPETTVLVALANQAGVLRNVFDKKELKARKKRIQEIGEGDLTAAAVSDVVKAIQVSIAAAAAAAAAASAAS